VFVVVSGGVFEEAEDAVLFVAEALDLEESVFRDAVDGLQEGGATGIEQAEYLVGGLAGAGCGTALWCRLAAQGGGDLRIEPLGLNHMLEYAVDGPAAPAGAVEVCLGEVLDGGDEVGTRGREVSEGGFEVDGERGVSHL
jgi:hypothetical protein